MQTTILELAISLIFLYLMLSAACSAIQEIIANIFRWRAKTLEKGIEGLLDKNFKEEFYKTPLISGLCSPNARGQLTHKPSYIPTATFALSVLQLAATKGINLSAPPTANDPKTTQLLQSLLRGTTSVEDQKKRLEDWFEGSMDRVSGWYKRKAHAVLWIISIILCVLVNADSISLGNAFWNDSTLRAAITTAATEKVRSPAKAGTTTPKAANDTPPGASATAGNSPGEKTEKNPGAANNAAAGAGASTVTGTTGNHTDDDAFKRLDEVRGALAKVNVPLGWCHIDRETPEAPVKCWPDLERASQVTKDKSSSNTAVGVEKAKTSTNDPRLRVPLTWKNWDWWLLKLFGIAITALAISQGAPFWFDLLQKAVNLRLAGDAPDEKKK